MSDTPATVPDAVSPTDDRVQQSRRDFLLGLGRWSKIAIGAAVFGNLATGMPDAQAGAWANRRGGGGGWVNGGGSWINRRGGWINGGGGGWVNGRGGGWINRR